MPPKSIFRQPGAQHFQLVHRSQRDPLINDPDASQHVLKSIQRKKGKTRAELETELPQDSSNTNVGEAAQYGVYYDDTEYNYMQHLRQVGLSEDGVESVLIDAPTTTTSNKKTTIKQKEKVPILLKEDVIPAEALPSTSELPQSYAYESQQAVPTSIAGFQPDMDPHLRQVLEALEDEAFVEDDLEEDFFGELVGDGERESDEEIEFEFDEDGVVEEQDEEKEKPQVDAEDWQARFAQFKKAQQKQKGTGSVVDYASEGGDTVGRLPEMSVIGGKRRRKGTSDASGYSMSSSSMFRNAALQTLDERFDQIILKEYAEEDEDEQDPFDDDALSNPSSNSDDSDDEAPDLITSREDFSSMMDDFLTNYEILGRKMKHKLTGETSMAKLDTLRRAMGTDERVRVMWDGEREGQGGDGDGDEEEDLMSQFEKRDEKERWDCETILTTYSNVENHPRLVRARDPRPVPKIVIDPKTGMPTIDNADAPPPKHSKRYKGKKPEPIPEDLSEIDEENENEHQGTITRPRSESPTSKKARKAAVKAERQARRVDKKANKEQFGIELRHQMRGVVGKEMSGKVRKL